MEEIQFDEASHSYSDGSDIKYTSVTTLIGMYTNTYDQEFWSMYTALKDHQYKVIPNTQDRKILVNRVWYKLEDLQKDFLFSCWDAEVKAKWATITAEACHRGNITHNALEDGINQSKGDILGKTNRLITSTSTIGKKRQISTIHDLNATSLSKDYPLVYTRLSGYIERGFSIFAEKRVHIPYYGVAGMIDVPLIHGDFFAILDWKTNKNELHKTAGYYKKVNVGGKWIKSSTWVETGEKFKYPLNMLEASKFNIYALQLSLYSYILERWGYKPMNNHLEIIHFQLNKEPVILKMPYLRDEVMIMLEHHRVNNLNVA